FLDRTPRGRMATRAAYEYLGKTYQRAEPSDQGRLAGL
ncbi:MAG TPA: Holliday junction branch migration DNA helicase RuvB, partial [Dehalococcoidia bacterium]|nr:Holliday junction branch migration DNA helicase RuvB [Dehalococcoidia bacterium]